MPRPTNNSAAQEETVFILGAGFNADARCEAGVIYGHSINIGKYKIDCGYPVLSDLPHICYPDDNDDPKHVEEKIAESIVQGDFRPLSRLTEKLFEADWYIASRLAPRQGRVESCYDIFFNRFGASSFLTFNYDSFVEIFLLRRKRWNPVDGYGVLVDVAVDDLELKPADITPSVAKVIHLHGTLCVFESRTRVIRDNRSGIDMVKGRRVSYRFDPESIGALFSPYGKEWAYHGDDDSLTSRVVAPIREKARELTRDFVQAMYREAQLLIEEADRVISVGYSFNPADECSYKPLLETIVSEKKSLYVVTPEASSVVERLKHELPKLNVTPISKRFKDWVGSDFLIEADENHNSGGPAS